MIKYSINCRNMAKKKITLKSNNGDELYPLTVVQQVEGLKEALDDKLGKTEKAASATNANTSKKLCTAAYGGGDLNLNTFTVTDGSVEYRSIIPNTAANMPDPTGYQNSVMSFGLHDNGATAQMFFAKDKPLYYRSSHTGEWQQIAYKSDVDSKLPLSGGTLTGDLTAPSFKKNLTSGVAEAVMAYPVNISWGNDLNGETYLKAGMYQMSSKSSTLNQPSATGYGNVITVNSDTETYKTNAGQIYLDSAGFSSKAYIRAGQVLSGAAAGYHITDKTWREVRFIDELVTTSHIADTAITPAKIQTSIALNGTPSMTVEPTTSSPDKTIASVGLVKEAVDGIEIGGTNLILNSDFSRGTKHWEDWNKTASFSVENGVATFTLNPSYPDILKTSVFEITNGQQYIVSLDVKSDDSTTLDYCYLMGVGVSNIYLGGIGGITSEWKRRTYSFTATTTGSYCFGFGKNSGGSFQFRKVKIEKGNKATDWSPAPEDITLEISNAETRSKAHAEDYTNAEIDKIENGQTVAQKANSLYDDDSGTYKNWGEIDSAITNKIGNEFESYATKQYVDNKVASIGTPGNATETGAGIVRAATQAEVAAGHVSDNDPAEMAFVRPETLQSKLSNYPTTTAMTQAINESRQIIYYQSSQPSGGKNGDIWIKP